MAILTAAGGCGDQTGPEFESALIGRWDGSFRGVVSGVAVRLDLTEVRDGVISGTGQLGYTGNSVNHPLTGRYDPPLLQVILTGEDNTYFSLIAEIVSGEMTGSALSTFSTRVLPGGGGPVHLTRRPAAGAGGSE